MRIYCSSGSSQGESCRKRASTALSTGSVDSDTETSKTERNASFPKPLAPKIKRRRKQPPIRETRLKFFQDSAASYCGVLYQRRNQNVWSKRYCKIVETRLRGFRYDGGGGGGVERGGEGWVYPLFGARCLHSIFKESRSTRHVKLLG